MIKTIFTEKENNKLHFYLVFNQEMYYLFTHAAFKSVDAFFRNGRTEKEILNHHWGRNCRLDKTISQIPKHIRRVEREHFR